MRRLLGGAEPLLALEKSGAGLAYLVLTLAGREFA